MIEEDEEQSNNSSPKPREDDNKDEYWDKQNLLKGMSRRWISGIFLYFVIKYMFYFLNPMYVTVLNDLHGFLFLF